MRMIGFEWATKPLKVTKFHIKTGLSVTLCHLWAGGKATYSGPIFSNLCKVVPLVHFCARGGVRNADAPKCNAEAGPSMGREGFSRDIRVSKSNRTDNEHVRICQVWIVAPISAFDKVSVVRSSNWPAQKRMSTQHHTGPIATEASSK
jgi:hypothetical protein